MIAASCRLSEATAKAKAKLDKHLVGKSNAQDSIAAIVETEVQCIGSWNYKFTCLPTDLNMTQNWSLVILE